MSEPAALSRRARARQLTREDIIDAAAELVAGGGYDALNMRALADQCDVAVTTIYRLVTDKDQLLGDLADRLLANVADPSLPAQEAWDDEVVAVFTSAHERLCAHPELAEIVARVHTNGRVGFATAERTIRALQRAGLDGESAAAAFNALVAYTIGFTMRQLHTTPQSTGERYALAQGLPADAYPNVHAHTLALIARPTDAQFEQGLRALVRGWVG